MTHPVPQPAPPLAQLLPDGFARSLHDAVRLVLAENHALLHALHSNEIEDLAAAVRCGAPLFLCGQGRSGLVARMAAMRLAHLGATVHVVGETTTPPIRPGDWLIAISSSGTSGTILQAAQSARAAGARVLLITAATHTPIAHYAQAVVTLAAPVKNDHSGARSAQFAGTLFEQGALLLMDALFLVLSTGREREELYQAHANLE